MTQSIHPNRGGTGRTDAPDNNEIPIGDGVGGFDFLALIAGAGISITKDDVAETITVESTGEGTGDMLKTMYDPNTVEGDAFDMDNMVEGADAKVLTASERAAIAANTAKNSYPSADSTKVDHISVTQAVDLDQMETDIAALANGMVYKGDWDASAGTFPGAGAAQVGWLYYVSVAGTVDGEDFSIGDNIVATVDNASTATYAANWSKHDQTDAVQSVAGLVGSITGSALKAAMSFVKGDVALGNVDNTSDATKNAATATVTNKRNQQRVYSTTSTATLTPEIDTYDVFDLTAQAAALTIANHSTSTPADGEQMRIRVKDNATGRAISFGTNYSIAGGVALPTTTTASKQMTMGFEWYAGLSKWVLVALAEEA